MLSLYPLASGPMGGAMQLEDLDMQELTPGQVARALRVSPRTVQYWLEKGQLPADDPETIAGRRKVRIGDLRRFMVEHSTRKGLKPERYEARLNEWLLEHVSDVEKMSDIDKKGGDGVEESMVDS